MPARTSRSPTQDRRIARPNRRRRLRVPARQPAPVDLDLLAAHWQLALDAGERALTAAAETLPAEEVRTRRGELNRERRETAAVLACVARARGVQPAPLLSRALQSHQ